MFVNTKNNRHSSTAIFLAFLLQKTNIFKLNQKSLLALCYTHARECIIITFGACSHLTRNCWVNCITQSSVGCCEMTVGDGLAQISACWRMGKAGRGPVLIGGHSIVARYAADQIQRQ